MMYMPHLIGLIAALCLFNPLWRVTGLAVLTASAFNIFIVSPLIVPGASYQDLYFIAGLIDAITAGIIILYGKGGRYLVSGILSLFVLINAMLLIELKFQPFFVYHHYESLIFSLNILQIALLGGGIGGSITRIREWFSVPHRTSAGMVEGEPSIFHSVRHSDMVNSKTTKGAIK